MKIFHLFGSDSILDMVDHGERGVTANFQVLVCTIKYKIWSFTRKEHTRGKWL